MGTERKIPYITNTYRKPTGENIKVKTVDGVDEVATTYGGETKNIITVKDGNTTTNSIDKVATSVDIYSGALEEKE